MGYIRFKTSHLILLPMETYLLYILHIFWLVLHYTLYILVIRVRLLQRGGDCIEMRQKLKQLKLINT